MKVIQNTIEKLLYIILLLVFIVSGIAAVYAVKDSNLIVENQVKGSQAVKVYINCLIQINPKGNISAQEQACFASAPRVTK